MKNKSAVNIILFYLEIDNQKEVDFNGEALTFTLLLVKIFLYSQKCFQKLKTESYCVGGKHRSNT